MAYMVALTRRAQIDISAAEKWISRLGSAAVGRWRSRMFKAVQQLESDANRFPPSEEAIDLGFDLREVLFGRWPHIYRMLFTIDGYSVHVLRIRHTARDHISDSDI